MRDLFRFAATTGLRAGELVNLRWQSVDFERRQISVVSSEGFTTKSGRSRTVVPLNETALEVIRSREHLQRFSPFVFHRNGQKLQRTLLVSRVQEGSSSG